MNHMIHPDQILYSKLLYELRKHQLFLKSTQTELYFTLIPKHGFAGNKICDQLSPCSNGWYQTSQNFGS